MATPGERLKKARELRGLKVTELARELAKIDPKKRSVNGLKSMLSKVERNVINSTNIDFVKLIAEYLDLPIDWISKGEGYGPDYVPPHATNEYICFRLRILERDGEKTLPQVAKDVGVDIEHIRAVIGGHPIDEAAFAQWARYFIHHTTTERSVRDLRAIIDNWWRQEGAENTKIVDDPNTDPNIVRQQWLFLARGHGMSRWSALNVIEEQRSFRKNIDPAHWGTAFLNEVERSKVRNDAERVALENLAKNKARIRSLVNELTASAQRYRNQAAG